MRPSFPCFLLFACVPAFAPAVFVPPGGAQSPGFELQFLPAADRDYTAVREFLESEGRFADLIASLNETFALPERVVVSFEQGAGPLYDPDERTIVMNYEFIAMVAGQFDESDPEVPVEDQLWMVLDVAEFVLFHEIGHALIDVLGLPVVGREEDAVDSLATVLMVEFMEEPEAALSAAASFDSMAAADEDGLIEDAEMWDEHSLDEQRFWAITCWVYGSDPEEFMDLVGGGWLSPERAASCPEDYWRQSDSWHALLDAALRE